MANLHAATIHQGYSSTGAWTEHRVDFGAIVALELIIWSLVVSKSTTSSLLFVWTYSWGKGSLIHAEVIDNMRGVVKETGLWVVNWLQRVCNLDNLGWIVLSLTHWKSNVLSILHGGVLHLKVWRVSSILLWVIASDHATWARRQLRLQMLELVLWTSATTGPSSSHLAFNGIQSHQDVVGSVSCKCICLGIVLDQGK